MNKVLIISYFFPPSNLTSAQRGYGFFKYLNKFGYEPTVLTRSWSKNSLLFSDVIIPDASQSEEINEEGHIIRIPYMGTLRDRFYAKYGNSKLVFIRKLLTLIESVIQSFDNAYPYREMYEAARKIIIEKKVNAVIISGNPYYQFKYGYKLKNEFPDILWIADYRDPWTTHSQYKNNFILKFLEKRAEKRWLSNTDLIITVCKQFKTSITSLVNKECVVIPNGYSDVLDKYKNSKPIESEFRIVYSGTILENQDFSVFINGFKKFIDNTDRPKIKLTFLGSYNSVSDEIKLKKWLQGYEQYYTITKRVNYEEAILFQKQAHILLMVPYKGMEGTPSSKIYDYIGLNTRIILTPSDNDIIEEMVSKFRHNYVTDTSKSVQQIINQLYSDFISNKWQSLDESSDIRVEFSRKFSVQLLAENLNRIRNEQ